MQHRHLNESRRQKAVSLAPLALRPPLTTFCISLSLSLAVSAAHLCRERFARQAKCLSLPSVLPHLPFAVTHGGDSAPLKTSCTAATPPPSLLVDRLNMPPAARCGCECVNTRRDLGTGRAALAPALLSLTPRWRNQSRLRASARS